MSKKYTENIIGNGSTIVKYILVMLATKTIAGAAAHGYNLPVDAVQLAEIFGYILGFVIATIDAKWPNNIFNNIFEFGIAKITEKDNDITFADTELYPEDNMDDVKVDDE
ncbi:hypothetical protein [Methanobrevibacter sp.]|uniref:hypothetical protein n=1 Tax=Methanobrevibacter sp. TaxID=66852 RepID=UPI003865DFD3